MWHRAGLHRDFRACRHWPRRRFAPDALEAPLRIQEGRRWFGLQRDCDRHSDRDCDRQLGFAMATATAAPAAGDNVEFIVSQFDWRMKKGVFHDSLLIPKAR